MIQCIVLFQVLLVSSSGHPDRWVVPGGKMQPNEAAEYSAVREALEESGAVGHLDRFLGTFDNTDRRHRTKVYVLYVSRLSDDYDDKDIRKRKWFSVEEAQKVLATFKPLQLKYLVALKQTKSTNQSLEETATTQQQPQQKSQPINAAEC